MPTIVTTTILRELDEREVEILVTVRCYPPERRTHDYPGFPAWGEVVRAKMGGAPVTLSDAERELAIEQALEEAGREEEDLDDLRAEHRAALLRDVRGAW